MDTIILFDDENKTVDFFNSEDRPIVSGNSISWNTGQNRLEEIQINFIVIEGVPEIEIGTDISDLIPQDKKESCKSETDLLKAELSATQSVVNEMLLGGLGL